MTDSFDLDERGDLPEACMPMTSLLQPFVDDELDATDREAVAEHITACDACLVEVQQQQTVRAALRQLEPEVIPEALLARIRAELDAVDAELEDVVVLHKPTRLRAFARGVAMMVPAAAAAAALFFVVQQGGGDSEGANVRASLPVPTQGATTDEPNPAPVPVPEAQPQIPATKHSLPAGIELVGGQPRVGGGAYEYAEQSSGLHFRDRVRPVQEGAPEGTRQVFRGRAYFLSHDAQGRAQVELEIGGVVHQLVQLDAREPGAPEIELSLDATEVQRLVAFTHSLLP